VRGCGERKTKNATIRKPLMGLFSFPVVFLFAQSGSVRALCNRILAEYQDNRCKRFGVS
jgi:hypothetical protein